MNIFKKIVLLSVFILQATASFAQIEVSVDHVIVQDHYSGKILFERDADDSIYPASMTKIMTAIVA